MEKINGAKTWDILWKVVSATFIPWMALLTLMLFSIDKRVAVIEDRPNPPQWLVERVAHTQDGLDKHTEEHE
jgi:hypothetical protein